VGKGGNTLGFHEKGFSHPERQMVQPVHMCCGVGRGGLSGGGEVVGEVHEYESVLGEVGMTRFWW
jgi:hypothetical protein